MKILIVSDCATHPINAGNKKCIFEQCEILKKLGNEIYFLYVQNVFAPLEDYEQTRDFWREHFFYFHRGIGFKLKLLITNKIRKLLFKWYWRSSDRDSLFLANYINKLQKKYQFDICIFQYFYFSKTASKVTIPKTAIMTHDCFSYKSLALNMLCEYSLTASEEAKALQRFKHIFAIQENEAVFFQKLAPHSNVYTVFSNFSYSSTPITNNHNILFLSGNNTFNINGIIWFTSEIFPLIKDKFPDTNLIIGGSICEKLKENALFHDKNIILKGRIDNPKLFYQQGDIAINPTYQGTGLKIKTFEAISYDKVVIVHPHSTEGIYSPENAPIFSSSIPKEWLTFISQIWKDTKEIHRIKLLNKAYINNLNLKIEEEYHRFLSNNK